MNSYLNGQLYVTLDPPDGAYYFGDIGQPIVKRSYTQVDPTYTLTQMLKQSREMLDAPYPMEDPPAMARAGLELAETFENLHKWMMGGGFPPAQWATVFKGHKLTMDDDREDNPDRKYLSMIQQAKMLIAKIDEPDSLGANFLLAANQLACIVLWFDNHLMAGKRLPKHWRYAGKL